MPIKRRTLLLGGTGLLGSMGLANTVQARILSEGTDSYGGKMVDGVLEYHMIAEPTERAIVAGVKTPTLEYRIVGQSKDNPFPIIRVKPNQKLRVHVTNKMHKTTTVHWHGIRLPNAMDGVPYLTQPPIKPNETFTYEFTCPDAGTFWFHSHQNALEQMARGQMGVLIVDDFEPNSPAVQQFSREAVWVIKDYYIDNFGNLDYCTSTATSASSGLVGRQKRVNGKPTETLSAPAGSWVRLRLVNGDNTRLLKVYAIDENQKPVHCPIIAIDSNPMKYREMLDGNYLTPGQRLDIAVRVPKTGHVTLKTAYKTPLNLGEPDAAAVYPLGRVQSNGEQTTPTDFIPLPINPIPPVQLNGATTLPFVFAVRGELGGKIWSINGKSMPKHSTMEDIHHDAMQSQKGITHNAIEDTTDSDFGAPADFEEAEMPTDMKAEQGKTEMNHATMGNHKDHKMGIPFHCFTDEEERKALLPDMHTMHKANHTMTEPLAELKLGQTYIFRIINDDKAHSHPIHLHGHTFTILKSNQRDIKPYHTDTFPLQPEETVDVAFVADNVGDWMFHCHIIEHASTGMMGYVRVYENEADLQRIKPKFALMDMHNKPVTHDTYKGERLLVAFGYLNCTDICPAELATMTDLLYQLEAKNPQYNYRGIFISVDPKRDTPEKLRDFITEFYHPNIVGLSGTEQQVLEACQSFNVHYEKYGASNDGFYSMLHTTNLFAISENGDYQTDFPYTASPTHIMRDLKQYWNKL